MVDRMDVMVSLPPTSQGGKPFYYKVGVAFALRNGPGFSVELAAIPVPQDGKYRFLMSPPREQQHSGGSNWSGSAGTNRPPPAQARQATMPIDSQEGEEQAPW